MEIVTGKFELKQNYLQIYTEKKTKTQENGLKFV